jgi:cardiolipin synthase
MGFVSAELILLAQVALTALGALTAFAAVTTARTPQGAVAWVVFLVSFPLLALPAFALFGRIGHDYERRRRASDREAAPEDGAQPAAGPTRLAALAGIADRPVVAGNRAQLLIDGEATFGAIFEALDEARHEALVQFYILRGDALGRALQARLVAAARRGVQVRLLYDALGSLTLGRGYVRALREAGVEVHAIRGPRRPVGRFGVNFRNHRKTVVVDGRLGFTGGLNVGQEYLDGGPHFEAWRDTFLRIEGPMVEQLRTVFAQDWAWSAGSPLGPAPCSARPVEGGAPGLVTASGPTDPLERGSLFLCGLVGLARARLWIATPYFVPHTDLLTAIQLAAMRGVSVRLLVPGVPDHLLPWYASRAYFDDVQAVGVEVWEYEAGFMHSKVILVDDDIASVGTINLDIRSVMLNFEATATLEDQSFAGEVEAMLQADFARSKAVPEGGESRRVRLLAPVARLFGPIL